MLLDQPWQVWLDLGMDERRLEDVHRLLNHTEHADGLRDVLTSPPYTNQGEWESISVETIASRMNEVPLGTRDRSDYFTDMEKDFQYITTLNNRCSSCGQDERCPLGALAEKVKRTKKVSEKGYAKASRTLIQNQNGGNSVMEVHCMQHPDCEPDIGT